MDEIKLKPCPFCGCEMEFDTVISQYCGPIHYLVGKPDHAKDCMMSAISAPRHGSKELIAAFWNKRAEMNLEETNDNGFAESSPLPEDA